MSTSLDMTTDGGREVGRCQRCGAAVREGRFRLGEKEYVVAVAACGCEAERYGEEAARQLAESYVWQLRRQVGERLWREATLEGFVRSAENVGMVGVVEGFRGDELPNCLVLSGPSGCGKTRLALVAARREVERLGVRGRFMSVPELLRQLRGLPSEQLDAVYLAKRAGLLVLDDVPTLTERESLDLLEVIDYRYRHERATIVTTNVAVENFERAFGVQVASRLMDREWSVVAAFAVRGAEV